MLCHTYNESSITLFYVEKRKNGGTSEEKASVLINYSEYLLTSSKIHIYLEVIYSVCEKYLALLSCSCNCSSNRKEMPLPAINDVNTIKLSTCGLGRERESDSPGLGGCAVRVGSMHAARAA